MGVRGSATEATGTSGASFVKGQLEELGWGVVGNTEHDNGTDLLLEARDERRYSLHVLLGAQVKSGPSWFNEPETDDSGSVVGWWFREDHDHFDDWLGHDPAHLVVLHDPQTRRSYWVQVTPDAVLDTGKNAKILVPANQTIDLAHRQMLLSIATRRRTPTWEGSAYAGATVLTADRLRYALLVPRLIAPHPNAGVPDDLSAEACLAMVVLHRTDRLRTGLSQRSLLADPAATAARGWRWELAVKLFTYLNSSDPAPLVELADRASDPAEHAAGTVVAAAALMEHGQPARAAELLASALEADQAGPVDHAWLTCQAARAQADLGDRAAARETAKPALALQQSHPNDPTAAAIAGAAAHVVFTVADWAAGTLPAIIAAGDAAAHWWRTHVLAWGLGRQTDQQFAAWTGVETTSAGAQDLRSASLLAGFAGDHGGWRNAVSHLARLHLVLTDRHSDGERVGTMLSALVLAGDEANLKAATRAIVRHGPALAVRHAASELDLTLATRTTVRPALTLLAEGGDVVEPADADRHASWALDILSDPDSLEEKLHPDFLVSHAVSAALRGLAWSIGPEVCRRIVDAILDLPAQSDQLTAQDWGRLVTSLPPAVWTPEDTRRAADRASEHNFELEYSLLELAARDHPDVRAQLLEQAAAGSVDAIAALGEVRDLVEPVVSALVQISAEHVAAEREDARTNNSYAFGQINWGRLLVALNLLHPEAADWPSLLELLHDPSTHPAQVAPAVQVLSRLVHEVPADVLPDIVAALDQHKAPIAHLLRTDDLDAATRAFHANVEALAVSETRLELHKLLVGPDSDRHTAALLVGRRADPSDLPLISSLVGDHDPEVRAIAAEVVGSWAVDHPDLEPDVIGFLINIIIADPGTSAARRLSTSLSRPTVDGAQHGYRDALGGHVSARVRQQVGVRWRT